MYPEGKYHVKDSETKPSDESQNEFNKCSVWTVDNSCRNVKDYTYNEAIELTGTGWYTISLVVVLSLSQLAMSIDMFSFSTVVAFSSCDLQLNSTKKSILMSIPFLGPILMSYAWGYLSDTRGRRRSLLIAMWGSFTMSLITAFAPNWIVMALFKLAGTCFCCCAQSATYALLGESCPPDRQSPFLLIMTSIIHTSMGFYLTLSYLIGGLDFYYDLGFITFVPWRLLIIILASPLGISAIGLFFFYESPKFLLNAGREIEAVEVLKNICRRNGGDADKYPVKRVLLNEAGNVNLREECLLRSLWGQTAPLFTPPLLWRTLLLFYLLFVVYSTSSCLLVWLPFLVKVFSSAVSSFSSADAQGLCSMIAQIESKDGSASCASKVELPLVIFAASAGATFCILNFFMSRLATRRRLLAMLILIFSSGCCIGTRLIPNNLTNVILYFGVVANCLCMGILFSYCVDLYPTSFRGMATCLGVLVARVSGLVGINLVGPYILTECSTTFFSLAIFILSGAVMATMLPTDKQKKTQPT